MIHTGSNRRIGHAWRSGIPDLFRNHFVNIQTRKIIIKRQPSFFFSISVYALAQKSQLLPVSHNRINANQDGGVLCVEFSMSAKLPSVQWVAVYTGALASYADVQLMEMQQRSGESGWLMLCSFCIFYAQRKKRLFRCYYSHCQCFPRKSVWFFVNKLFKK